MVTCSILPPSSWPSRDSKPSGTPSRSWSLLTWCLPYNIQVNVEQRIFRVYAGGEDPAPHPTPPEADGEGVEAFLASLDLDISYWHVLSKVSVWRQICQLLLSYKDVFTTPDQKVGLAKFGDPFCIKLLPGSQPVKSRDRGLKPAQI